MFRFNFKTRDGGFFYATFLFATLCGLLVLTVPLYGTVEPQRQGIFMLVVVALGIVWLSEIVIHPQRILQRKFLLLLPLCALIIYALWQADLWGAAENAISFDPYGTRIFAYRLLAYALCLGIGLRAVNTLRRAHILFVLIVALTTLSGAFGILRIVAHRSGQGFGGLAQLKAGLGFAQFINPNHYATLGLMAFGLLAGWLAAGGADKRRERRPFYLAVMFFLTATIVASRSRGGLLAMLLQLSLLIFIYFSCQRARRSRTKTARSRSSAPVNKFPIKAVAGLVLAIILFVGLMLWIGGTELGGKLADVSGEVNIQAEQQRWNVKRLQIWEATWQMFKAHKWTGVGYNGFWIAITQFHDGSGRMIPQQAHNDYLELLASGGILGLLPVAVFAWLAAAGCRRNLRSVMRERRALTWGAVTGITGALAHGALEFGLHVTLNALVFVVLLVLAIAPMRDAENNPGENLNPYSSLYPSA